MFAGIPLFLHVLTSLENHYTGWLDEFIAIDCKDWCIYIIHKNCYEFRVKCNGLFILGPPTVQVTLNILKPALSKQTREALTFLPQDRRVWMKYLDERISRSERRAVYGGTKPPVTYN